ncbi:alpha/beta-hydrolase, partial [Cubamyces lactineus]
VHHEGTPEGQFTKVGIVESYVGTPSGDCPKDKVVLFFSDVFGIKRQNNLLLADDYARKGFKVVLPDLFEGDALPEDVLNTGTFNFPSWLGKHGAERVAGIIRTVQDALKAESVTKFAAAGFCFGARPVFGLAFTNEVAAVAVTHPSLLQIPIDLEKYVPQSKAPLLMNLCETDSQYPPEAQAKADEILGSGKFAPGYTRTYWDGCTHGIAVRGDMVRPCASDVHSHLLTSCEC